MEPIVVAEHSAYVSSGSASIDVGGLLGGLRAAAATGHALDSYLYSCAAAQFWADLALAADGADTALQRHLTAQRLQADRLAGEAADAFLARRAAAPTFEWQGTLVVPLAGCDASAHLDKALRLPLPECCGYDIADLDQVADDAARLVGHIGTRRPVLVVGVRTGGGYLAPLWRSALAALAVVDVHGCNCRPAPDGGVARTELAAALAWARARPGSVAVIVDDQPDTGATIGAVADALGDAPAQRWCSSVGRVWRHGARGPAAADAAPTVRRPPDGARLWECLLAHDHGHFFARLAACAGLPTLPRAAQLVVRCPSGEARYGRSAPWKPWNHATLQRGARRLVNPKKTPLTVVDACGNALLHLRFVGERLFGLAEFRRVQAGPGARAAWFFDGYRIEQHLGPTQALRERLAVAASEDRAALLEQCAALLRVGDAEPLAIVRGLGGGPAAVLRLQERFAELQQRLAAPELSPARLRALPCAADARYGPTGRPIRSALRHAFGFWHWRVDAGGRVQRFHLDTLWGELGWPELELAAFAIEHRLAAADTRRLAVSCGVRHEHVGQSAAAAGLALVDSMVKCAKHSADPYATVLRQDLAHTLDAICEIGGCATH